MICDIAHGIYCFLCCACCHKHTLSHKVFFHSYLTEDIFQKHLLGGHFSVARIAVCKHSSVGFNYLIAESAELFNVILNDRIMKHIMIHRRGDDLFAGARHYSGREHIIGYAVGDLSDNICACGSYHYNICLLCKCNVLNTVFKIAVKGVDKAFVLRERFKGHRRDEILCIRGHKHMDRAVHFFQHTGKIGYLIGRNASRYAKEDGFSCQHFSAFLSVFGYKIIVNSLSFRG